MNTKIKKTEKTAKFEKNWKRFFNEVADFQRWLDKRAGHPHQRILVTGKLSGQYYGVAETERTH